MPSEDVLGVGLEDEEALADEHPASVDEVEEGVVIVVVREGEGMGREETAAE